jgi:hypothetical protein
MIDPRHLFRRTILIRLTANGDGFISTVRYGALYRRSKAWIPESRAETLESAHEDRYSDEHLMAGGEDPDESSFSR